MENNNAPFYVGQKVVALITAGNTYGQSIFKDQQYCVLGLYQCVCGSWKVDVGLTNEEKNANYCKLCRTFSKEEDIVWVAAKFFAPITPPYADITAELAAQVTVGDTCDQPVKTIVNN